jgi:hypothetical protein
MHACMEEQGERCGYASTWGLQSLQLPPGCPSLTGLELGASQLFPLLPGPVVHERGHVWAEPRKLVHPVGQRGERSDDHEGTVDADCLEVAEEADGLDLRRTEGVEAEVRWRREEEEEGGEGGRKVRRV